MRLLCSPAQPHLRSPRRLLPAEEVEQALRDEECAERELHEATRRLELAQLQADAREMKRIRAETQEALACVGQYSREAPKLADDRRPVGIFK